MKTNNSIKRFLLGGITSCALFGAFQANSLAAVVIHDTFTTGTFGNRKPDTINTPNLTWSSGWQGSGTQIPSLEGGRLRTGFNSWHYLDISNSATLTKPTEITLSADLTVNNIQQNNFGAGVALGFYSTTTGTSAQHNFNGLILEGEFPANTARISIWLNGTRIDAYTITSFDKAASYNLKYTVNTSTGSITSVYLNDTAITLNWKTQTNAGIFTDANTNYVGIWGRSNNSVDQFGYIDNFKIEGDFVVSQVPEPATVSLLIGIAAFAGIFIMKVRR
ncbi:PEP-CTERM sorting domain-containing protein [Opitutaceae bacterium TAV4]|nr:PEP-CTERM sorting domain-containing protein [Opitutaceae bacterium TAV4]RRJ99577.1 PEP-CTERM sorting domain-containing protein [Opitutaceae bacterium TAV3]